ncbi:MAG TPA: thermonuclease family protein, partial [Gemmatimonadota bacterium]|nr:thermonuclease family protein [Gemmatimonadota bacterium]
MKPNPIRWTLLAAALVLVLPATGRAQDAECVVAYVLDGDNFNCRNGRTVRLLGIDAPEGGRFGDASRRALATLLPVDARVRLEFDGERTDSEGRLRAYVFTNGRMVNQVMIRLGYAFFRPDPDHPRYAERLRAAEAEAK